MRRETEHLIHLPKQALRALKIAIDLFDDSMQALRLSPQVGHARNDGLAFPLDDSTSLRGEMRNAHKSDCTEQAGRATPTLRLDQGTDRSFVVEFEN